MVSNLTVDHVSFFSARCHIKEGLTLSAFIYFYYLGGGLVSFGQDGRQVSGLTYKDSAVANVIKLINKYANNL